MQDSETLIQTHAEAAHRLLKEADYELGRCNIGLTSEKLWEAAASAVKAVCVSRGWPHDKHVHLQEAIDLLVKETGNDSLYTGFSIAYDGQLFIGSLDEEDVDADRPVVRRLVNNLLSVAEMKGE